jgi:nucleotide-binding universal stress UspA family protein
MKHILVQLDASPRAAVRLSLAQQLGQQHGARVTAFYGVLPAMLSSPWMASDLTAATVAALIDIDKAERERARAIFDRAAIQGPLDWVDGGEAPAWLLQQQAHYADLLVLGQTDPADALTGPVPPNLVPDTVLASGKPTLLVPLAGIPEALPQRVLVAWKPCREAARAVTAALPWLQRARDVHVAVHAETDDGSLPRGPALVQWLGQYGITGVQVHDLGSGDVGESLLSRAADLGAGLLVMGCYGHTRAREWVLGGATRTVLRSMALPVLMVH